MKTQALIIGIVMMSLVFVAGGVSWAAGKTGRRQMRQQERIDRGVRSGEVTRGESRRLNREQDRIQRTKRRALADDRISPRERRRVNGMLDRASKHIYRANHNRKARYNHRPRHRPYKGSWHRYHRRPYHYGHHYKRHRYHWRPYHYRHHYKRHRPPYRRHYEEHVYYLEPSQDEGSSFSVAISQPEWSLAWSMDLD